MRRDRGWDAKSLEFVVVSQYTWQGSNLQPSVP